MFKEIKFRDVLKSKGKLVTLVHNPSMGTAIGTFHEDSSGNVCFISRFSDEGICSREFNKQKDVFKKDESNEIYSVFTPQGGSMSCYSPRDSKYSELDKKLKLILP